MTGTPHEHDDGREESRPPLPGPVDETRPPMTIIGGPAAEDTPQWQPTGSAAQTSPGRPASGSSTPPRTDGGPSTISGVFSNIKRTGRWECPAKISLVGACSDAVLDFREAVIASPEVELSVYDFLNSCKVIVPPGVGVDMAGGMSIMSSEKSQADSVVAEGAFRLRILRYGFCSDIKVITLAVGESEPKWWKRSG
ncbi:hypothetical protein [Serinicoccus sp. LYQ131]|uniref:hypothetical protein n=1 Tax=Serinicoccus sp. LYQ131 TaxID=3378797 RepID=UPI0038546169